jgi:hypothetical protein
MSDDAKARLELKQPESLKQQFISDLYSSIMPIAIADTDDPIIIADIPDHFSPVEQYRIDNIPPAAY